MVRASSTEATAGPGWLGVAITLAGVAAAAAVVLAVPELRHAASAAVSGNTGEIRHEVDSLGASGALVVFALAQIHAIVWYPAEILNTAAGYVYGFWLAMGIVWVSWLCSGLVAYSIGRAAARPLLYRIAGEERFLRGEHLVQSGGVPFLLGVRLIPIVPFSLISMVCGAAEIPVARFTWTTAVGYIPITAVFVYFGSRLESLSPTDPILLASAALLVALFAAARWVGRRPVPHDTEPT